MISIAERRKHILDCLARDGFVKVNDMAHELDVTPVTIRKDFKYLEDKKMLYRSHGSASPVNPQAFDLNVEEKEKINIREKKIIAQKACELLQNDDSIIIGSGSTVYMFADCLAAKNPKLTVVTASLKISLLLNKYKTIDIIQLGGYLRKNSLSVIGDYTAIFFDKVTCSKLFFGVDGIDPEHGVTNSNIEEANLNRKMIKSSLRTIILADSSKFGRRGFGKVCDLDEIDVIITDSGISRAMAQAIEEMGVELIIA
ncbi:MAG: DeoR/GlpR family DNA-binding transcription regulator [Bacteroidales bacterium]|jgi:DeoR family transcriptional regulator of aga operon|nr:DeoR/GlpR family DNA-binding transcription regulator [Bacteroidales bacterium]